MRNSFVFLMKWNSVAYRYLRIYQDLIYADLSMLSIEGEIEMRERYREGEREREIERRKGVRER